VADLAVYSNAIDEGKFLDSATWQKVFTPFQSPKGKVFQYGLGWFVKTYKGIKILWHTGWWMGYSALLIKIPEKHISFIILANSQDLSRPFYHSLNPATLVGLSDPFHKDLSNDLFSSAFARAFLDLCCMAIISELSFLAW
jgi:CubicO group peptidase (beta-lactamase class C family)